MNRILKLSITVPFRVLVLELRIVRGAAKVGFGVARGLAEVAAWQEARAEADASGDAPAPAEPSDATSAASTSARTAPGRDAPANGAVDPAEAPRQARRAAAVQRTRAKTTPAARPTQGARKPPAATTATDVPPAAEEQPRPRPRRAARKATAARPARKRSDAPGPAKVAAAREAEGAEEPVASVGPAQGAGPEIRLGAPWEGYDTMALDEILGRLADADETLLAEVRLYEAQGEGRQAILLAAETP